MKTMVGIGGNGLRSIDGGSSIAAPQVDRRVAHPYGDAIQALAKLYVHAEDIGDLELKARTERATRELLGGEVDCGNDEEAGAA
jgi:hypothetical protein